MEHYNEALEYTEVAANSAGTALSKYEDSYLNSVAAAQDRFKASFEQLSTSILKSDFLKNVVDSGADLISILASIIDTLGFVPTILMAISANLLIIKALTNDGILNTDKGIGKLVNSLLEVNKVGKNAAAGLSGFKMVKAYFEGASQAATGFSGALIKIVATHPVIAAIGVAIGALAFGIKKHYQNIHEGAMKSTEELENVKQKVDSITSEIKEKDTRIKELNSLDSLTDDQANELDLLKKQNKKLKEQLELYNDIKKVKEKKADHDTAKSFNTQHFNNKGEKKDVAGENITEQLQELDKEYKIQQNWFKKYGSDYKKFLNSYFKLPQPDTTAMQERWTKQVQKMQSDAEKTQQLMAIYAKEAQDYLNRAGERSANWSDEEKKAYDNATKVIQTYAKNYGTTSEKIEAFNLDHVVESLENTGDSAEETIPKFDNVKKSILVTATEAFPELSKSLKDAGLSEDEFAKYLYNAKYGLDNQKEALSKTTLEVENFSNSLKNVSASFDFYDRAQKEFNETGRLNAQTLQDIIQKYPGLIDQVANYVAGIGSAKDVILGLKGAYDADLNNFNQVLLAKLEASPQFYNSLNNQAKKAVNDFASAYNIDLSNVHTIEDLKYQVRCQFMTAWMKKSSALHSMDLKQAQELKGYLRIISGTGQLTSLIGTLNGNPKQIAAGKKQSELYNKQISELDQYIGMLSDFKKMENSLISYNPRTFTPASANNLKGTKSSGSSGSSGSSKSREDLQKEAFDREHALLQHRLEMDYISERQYYDALENLYKRYFAQGTESYMQYEEEVYNGRKKLLEKAKSDLKSFHDLVIDYIKKEKEKEIEALEKQLEAYEKIAAVRKRALDDLKDESAYTKSLTEKRKEVAILESRLEEARYDNSAQGVKNQQELEEELLKKKEELQEYEYEHSVETQKNAIDKELENEKSKTDAQIETIREFLNDQQLLVQEAWNTIDGMSNDLYQKLVEYNAHYGSGIETDITEKWNAAKQALLEYGNIAKAQASYNSMTSKLSSHDFSYSGSSGGYSPSPSSSPSYGGSVQDGQRVRASSSAKIYEYINGRPERQYYRKNPTYVVLSTKGGWAKVRHSSLNRGVTGWFRNSDLKAYKKGTNYVPKNDLYLTQDEGAEVMMKDGSLITPLKQGDKVWNNKSSDMLWELTNKPNDNWLLKNLANKMQNIKVNIPTCEPNTGGDINIEFGNMIVQGNADENVLNNFRKSLVQDVKHSIKDEFVKRGNTIRPR